MSVKHAFSIKKHWLKNHLKEVFVKNTLTTQKCIFSLINFDFAKHGFKH
jgi:hypothetical protein